MSDIIYRGQFPGLHYADARAAIAWLERAFGFEPLLVVDGPGGKVVHSQIWAGDSAIGISTVIAGDGLHRVLPESAGGVTHLLYFVVDGIDAHYARAQAAGAEIISPLADRDYGGRDYTCRDPEGFVWSFGTYAPSRDDRS